MIWAMLFYYLFASGGGNGLVVDIAKPVKQVVQNKETASQIIALNKQMLQEEAALAKKTGESKKLLAKLNGERKTTADEFRNILADLERQRVETRARILDGRFKMKELMTADEWERTYAMVEEQN